MNYLETLAYIECLSPTLERPTMDRIAAFSAEYGDPHKNYPSFHIGGTNGKGSTTAILDSVLRQSGLSVGRFTGPHLLRWNERFHVDGVAISDHDFARLGTEIRIKSEDFSRKHPALGPLTWFEFLAAMAFFYFLEKGVDVAVFEVGLGGRFDATNILQNILCSVITNIDLDHTHILGDTEEAIAYEKSGIFRSGVPAVTGSLQALSTLHERAKQAGAHLYRTQVPNALDATVFSDTGTRIFSEWASVADEFSVASKSLTLLGSHQQANALAAVAAVFLASKHSDKYAKLIDRVSLDRENLSRAFANVYWPGRLQAVPGVPLAYFDGAHNPAGAGSLRRALDSLIPSPRRHIVVGCFANKNAEAMLASLVRPGDAMYISEASVKRPTMSKEEMARIASALGADASVFASIPDAFSAACSTRKPAEPIITTGSFAAVKEIMVHLGWTSVEDGLGQCAKILEEEPRKNSLTISRRST